MTRKERLAMVRRLWALLRIARSRGDRVAAVWLEQRIKAATR